MGRSTPLALALLTLSLAACSKDSPSANDSGPRIGGDDDAGTQNGSDSGLSDGAVIGADAGAIPDSGPPPCVRDQDCESGKVCNLAMSPARCVAGHACTTDTDCLGCSALTAANRIECGHGFHVLSYCSADHGNVCMRGLSPCEPCTTDRECAGLHPQLGVMDTGMCLDYGGGQKYCGRPDDRGCPNGFVRENGQCKRTAGCSPTTVVCPAKMPGQQCTGTDQICAGTECPGTGGAKCSTNDLPGALGTCIGFCSKNDDCPPDLPICNQQNGICISGCQKGSCAGNQVCHADGFCREPCDSDQNCADRFGMGYYCNRPGSPPPRIYKAYRDRDSCAPLGCEQAVDCPAAGLVCDKRNNPPSCVQGCYKTDDCLSGEQCKIPGPGGPRNSYTRAECRALGRKTEDVSIGVCCNPGCTNRVLSCNINEFCCGEEGSPYEDPARCGTVTSTSMVRAEPGECFEIAPPPFCKQCMDDMECNSGWMFGFNVDPNINGGQPFQEQEFCLGVPGAMDLAMCGVTCNPNSTDVAKGCPRGWTCGPVLPPCFQDADCNGLTCVGANQMMMIPGRCQCGEMGVPSATCPTAYAGLASAVTNPRCVELGQNGEMYCVASYVCKPANYTEDAMMRPNYPAACLMP